MNVKFGVRNVDHQRDFEVGILSIRLKHISNRARRINNRTLNEFCIVRRYYDYSVQMIRAELILIWLH